MAVDLGNGTWGAGAETMHWQLYDRVKVETATLEHTLFGATVGETRQGAALTIADTNNFLGKQIPSQHKLTIHKVHFSYLADEVRTEAEIVSILDIYKNSQVRFKIQGKDLMFEIPMWYFMGGLNAVGAAAVVGANPLNATIFKSQWDLKIPIILQELTPFTVSIQHTTAPAAGLAGDKMSVDLEGRLDRRN